MEHDGVRRSEGVSVGVLDDRVVACDVARHRAHVVDGVLAWLLLQDDGRPFDVLVRDVVEATGRSRSAAVDDVRSAIELGVSLHLLGPADAVRFESAAAALPDGDSAACSSHTYRVLGESAAFRSHDAQLIAQIDRLLEGGIENVEPDQWITVSQTPTGEVLVSGPDSLRFASTSLFLSSLVDVLSAAAVHSRRELALGASAVRSASGDIWLLPHGIHGDRVLTASLVRAGCDYLGSEVIGVRSMSPGNVSAVGHPTPLGLDRSSRALLGLDTSDSVEIGATDLRRSVEVLSGELGPIAATLLCEFAPDEPASARRLEPASAVGLLLDSARNLASAPQISVQALCDLAVNRPILRIRYYDPEALAEILVANGPLAALDGLDRQMRLRARRRLCTGGSEEGGGSDPLDVRPSSGVVHHDATIEGEGTSFVIDLSGQTSWALRGLPRRIWTAARTEGARPLVEFIRSEADRLGGSDEHSSHMVSPVVGTLVEEGLLEQVGSDVQPHRETSTGVAGLHNVAPGLQRYGGARVKSATVVALRPWRRLTSEGHAIDWRGHRVLTDVESVRRLLLNLRSARVVDPTSSDAGAALIEIRTAPGRDGFTLVRLNGSRLWWADERESLPVLGVILANLISDQGSYGHPLGEISTITWRRRCLLHVGAPTSADDDGAFASEFERQGPIFGARVEAGDVLLPHHARMVEWLEHGANPDEMTDLWIRHELVGMLVEGVNDLVGGWLQALTQLSPSQSTGGQFLAELVGSGDLPLAAVHGGAEAAMIAERLLIGEGEQARTGISSVASAKAEEYPDDANRPEMALRSSLASWAAELGEVSMMADSAKVSEGGLVLDRRLLRILLPRSPEDDDGRQASDLVHAVTIALAELGLGMGTSAEVARSSVDAGSLYIGEDLAGGRIRRKLYASPIPDATWATMSEGWPTSLTECAMTPWAIAWKWRDGQADSSTRSTYFRHLGGAVRSRREIDPILDAMGSDWADVVAHLIRRLGVDLDDPPGDGDLLTIDEDGRRSVDLSSAGSQLAGLSIEAEVRWLAAVAGLSEIATDSLVAWSDGGGLSRLILGVDGGSRPFVNLYLARVNSAPLQGG